MQTTRLSGGTGLLSRSIPVLFAFGLSAATVGAVPPPKPPMPLATTLAHEAPDLDPGILDLALEAHACATRKGLISAPDALTIIDYSRPSSDPRFWVFDLVEGDLVYEELVAHGKGTGAKHATEFSNTPGSKQSSLGLFVTEGTYYGRNGYSLYLQGLEEGVNHLAHPRTIVMHGAWYVSDDFVQRHGRVGRSWGCPALRQEIAREVIDFIKEGTAVFAYYPDSDWLESSEFLGCS